MSGRTGHGCPVAVATKLGGWWFLFWRLGLFGFGGPGVWLGGMAMMGESRDGEKGIVAKEKRGGHDGKGVFARRMCEKWEAATKESVERSGIIKLPICFASDRRCKHPK